MRPFFSAVNGVRNSNVGRIFHMPNTNGAATAPTIAREIAIFRCFTIRRRPVANVAPLKGCATVCDVAARRKCDAMRQMRHLRQLLHRKSVEKPAGERRAIMGFGQQKRCVSSADLSREPLICSQWVALLKCLVCSSFRASVFAGNG